MDTTFGVSKLLELSADGQPPFYATAHSAGFDVCASEDVTIEPGSRVLVPTGLRIVRATCPVTIQFQGIEVPAVPELQLRPRSGLALKYGLTLLNSPSTIDADYRGEIKLLMVNFGREKYAVQKGQRLAQAVCALAIQLPGLNVVSIERGKNGFGSTGC